MKIISLWQPWASLWAGGKKRIETRGKNWFGCYDLPLWVAVHAAKQFKPPERALCAAEPFRTALLELGYAGPDDLPLGAVVGVVRVIRIYRFAAGIPLPDEPERSFGDYGHGRFGFVTDRNLTFETPIPLSGSQGVFSWERPADVPLIDRLATGTVGVNRPTAGQGSLFGATEGGWPP